MTTQDHFDDGGQPTTHEHSEVARDHCTTRRETNGSTTMPVTVYLVDHEPHQGKAGVLGTGGGR